MSDNNKSFEQTLSELEEIVAKLEKGECGLDESIALYETGVKLSAECSKRLENARCKIITLTDAKGENFDA